MDQGYEIIYVLDETTHQIKDNDLDRALHIIKMMFTYFDVHNVEIVTCRKERSEP